jgi:hypothetical protein
VYQHRLNSFAHEEEEDGGGGGIMMGGPIGLAYSHTHTYIYIHIQHGKRLRVICSADDRRHVVRRGSGGGVRCKGGGIEIPEHR